jgi:tetratricopeptide (TPR) repeat protein
MILPVLSVLTIAPNFALAQSPPTAPQPQPEVAKPVTPAPNPAPEPAIPAAVKLLPIDTAGVMLVNTQDQAWSALSQFGLFPADTAFPTFLFPLGTGIDFYTDVEPWLGEQIAIAFLSITDTDKTSINTSLLVAPIKDLSKIPTFLEKLKASRDAAPVERDYKGITILEWQVEETVPFEEKSEPDATTSQNPSHLAAATGKSAAAAEKTAELSQYQAPTLVSQSVDPALEQAQSSPVMPEPAKNAVPGEVPPEMPGEIPGETPAENPAEMPTETPESGPLTPLRQSLAIAILPSGYLVSASVAPPIERLIDAQSDPQRLADNPAFKRTITNPNFGRSLVVGYGDYTQIFKATALNQPSIEALPLPTPLPLPQADADLISIVQKVYDSVDGYLWVQPEGVRMRVGVGLKLAIPEPLVTALASPNQILQRLPETTYMAGNGKDLATIWKLLVAGVELQPKLKPLLETARKQSQQYIGVDDRDIFPWLDGEYVSFLYPTKQGWIPQIAPEIDLGAGLMIQTSDRPAAEAAMKKLDQFVQSRSNQTIKVATRPFKGQPITSWETSDNQKTYSLLGRNWVSEDTLLLLTGAGATPELTPKPVRSLTQSQNFQAAIAPLPPANTGYFYLNMGATLAFVNNTLLPKFLGKELANSPFIQPYKDMIGNIRSISSTSSIAGNVAETDVFLALAKTRNQPLNAQQLIDLGITKTEDGGDLDGAIGNFSRALRLEPNNAQAYYQRGRARVFKADYDKAIPDLDQAIQRDATNVDAYNQRGWAHQSLFNYRSAEQDYTQALQLQPDIPTVLVRRSQARFFLEDFNGAITDATRAITLDPANDIAYNARCYALARGLGGFKAALADCNKAVTMVEGTPAEVYLPVYLTSRCYVRANLGDKAALEDCDRATELNLESFEANADYLEDRGLAKAALGQKAEALADLQRALDVTPAQNTTQVQRLEKLLRSLQ